MKQVAAGTRGAGAEHSGGHRWTRSTERTTSNCSQCLRTIRDRRHPDDRRDWRQCGQQAAEYIRSQTKPVADHCGQTRFPESEWGMPSNHSGGGGAAEKMAAPAAVGVVVSDSRRDGAAMQQLCSRSSSDNRTVHRMLSHKPSERSVSLQQHRKFEVCASFAARSASPAKIGTAAVKFLPELRIFAETRVAMNRRLCYTTAPSSVDLPERQR